MTRRVHELIWKIEGVFFIGVSLLFSVCALAAEDTKKADLDGDGFKETELFYDGKKITKALIDEDEDGQVDGTIYYKNGFREKGERDLNRDGQTDTWIKYYMTGIPWIITRDKNNDGKPDYWAYAKNGFIYKRECDRNVDGKADARVLIPVQSDFRELDMSRVSVERQYDNNFDGAFEKVVVVPKRMPHVKVQNAIGAVGEL